METTPITISPKVDALSRYTKFLQIVSLFLKNPLTDTDIRILDEFYVISKGEINTENRKKVYTNLDMSQQQLNNYIRTLRLKGHIVENHIHKNLLPIIPENDIFSIVVNMRIQ